MPVARHALAQLLLANNPGEPAPVVVAVVDVDVGMHAEVEAVVGVVVEVVVGAARAKLGTAGRACA